MIAAVLRNYVRIGAEGAGKRVDKVVAFLLSFSVGGFAFGSRAKRQRRQKGGAAPAGPAKNRQGHSPSCSSSALRLVGHPEITSVKAHAKITAHLLPMGSISIDGTRGGFLGSSGRLGDSVSSEVAIRAHAAETAGRGLMSY